MKTLAPLILTLLILNVETTNAVERKALTADERATFLAKRTSGNMRGTFGSYGSLLYAVKDVVIHSESQEINQTRLRSPFPDFYKPTWRELFDSVARQTKSSWAYDPELDYWVFTEPPARLPYEIAIADKWESENRGSYVSYKPPTVPVGMDIYMMGTYSAAEEEQAFYSQVRDEVALKFARHFSEDVTTQAMSEVKVGPYNALHFKMSIPDTGIVWRQWVIVESGAAIAIVSAIEPEFEQAVFPDIQVMLRSFTLTKEPSEE